MASIAHSWLRALSQPAARQVFQKNFAVAARAPVPGAQAWRALSSPAVSTSPAFVERAPAEETRPTASEKKPRVKRVRKAVIEVTDRAKLRLAEIIGGKDPAPVGIRLGVRTRG